MPHTHELILVKDDGAHQHIGEILDRRSCGEYTLVLTDDAENQVMWLVVVHADAPPRLWGYVYLGDLSQCRYAMEAFMWLTSEQITSWIRDAEAKHGKSTPKGMN